jgi:glycosyltransferase involved in cell wall biosynthesis
MAVTHKGSGDWTVSAPIGLESKAIAPLRPRLEMPFRHLLTTPNPSLYSPSVVPSSWSRKLKHSDADIIHLHWVQWAMISVADIGHLPRPAVWTLHDMWAFCGAEHYPEDFRWREGYHRGNRPPGERGFDLNRWTWNRKRKHWRTPIHIVCPSHWLADCARSSALMAKWPISVVPNPLDTDQWAPMPQPLSRSLLGLPQHVPLLLFGASGGVGDPRKGFDLLTEALARLQGNPLLTDLQLVIFGQSAPQHPPALGFPVHYAGSLHDLLSLRALYNAVDVFVLPSRQDNLPNTGLEAHSCGTPIVCFNTCGLPDVVDHKMTGYLATSNDTEDLAAGCLWVLNQRHDGLLRENARNKALREWSEDRVASLYQDVYRQTLDSFRV